MLFSHRLLHLDSFPRRFEVSSHQGWRQREVWSLGASPFRLFKPRPPGYPGLVPTICQSKYKGPGSRHECGSPQSTVGGGGSRWGLRFVLSFGLLYWPWPLSSSLLRGYTIHSSLPPLDLTEFTHALEEKRSLREPHAQRPLSSEKGSPTETVSCTAIPL